MRTHTKKRSLELIVFCSLHTKQDYFQITKSSTSKNDGDKTVLSEISRGSYVTADDNMALTNYLVHPPSQNYGIMEIDVRGEMVVIRIMMVKMKDTPTI